MDAGVLPAVLYSAARRGVKMTLDELYKNLRALVSDKFRIRITDGKHPKVGIVPDSYTEKFPWTQFGGSTMEDAFMRAIGKLKNPEKDYRAEQTSLDFEGTLWKADEESIYSEKHIRLFLACTTKEEQPCPQ